MDVSTREISAAVIISKFGVGDIAKAARLAGLDWLATNKLSDDEIRARIYKPATVRRSQLVEPDCGHLYREFKRADVTLQLLWEEYQVQHGSNAYNYSAFCDRFIRLASVPFWTLPARPCPSSMRILANAPAGQPVHPPITAPKAGCEPVADAARYDSLRAEVDHA
jgi:hypothetical protein